jgi:hypothetical protein
MKVLSDGALVSHEENFERQSLRLRRVIAGGVRNYQLDRFWIVIVGT